MTNSIRKFHEERRRKNLRRLSTLGSGSLSIKAFIDNGYIEKIADHISNGVDLQTAASISGIPPARVNAYLSRGNREIHRRIEYEAMLDEDMKQLAILDDKLLVTTNKKMADEIERKISFFLSEKEVSHKCHLEEYENNEPYVFFVNKMETAISKVNSEDLQTIRRIADGRHVTSEVSYIDDDGNEQVKKIYQNADWKAASWLLEKRTPEQFGKINTTKIVGDPAAPVTFMSVFDEVSSSDKKNTFIDTFDEKCEDDKIIDAEIAEGGKNGQEKS